MKRLLPKYSKTIWPWDIGEGVKDFGLPEMAFKLSPGDHLDDTAFKFYPSGKVAGVFRQTKRVRHVEYANSLNDDQPSS